MARNIYNKSLVIDYKIRKLVKKSKKSRKI